MSPPKASDLQPLIELVARLRAPDGCPWDREQTLPDLRAYLLEEAHEVADAIDRGAWDELAGELGDLLFHIVFIGHLARESGHFELPAVIAGIHAKMVARHPHVFGGEQLADAAEVAAAWEKRKLKAQPGAPSLLAGVASSLPALLAAYRMTQKAAGVGFDWARPAEVLDKLEEEIRELRQALAQPPATDTASDDNARQGAIREEIGDLLFTIANLGRKLGVDPEAALAGTNLKFRRRFGHVEERLRGDGRRLDEASLAEMDALWEEAKGAERS